MSAEQPLIRRLPASRVGSHGSEAADLHALAGGGMDDWQVDALDALMSVDADGRWAAPMAVLIVARQNGKGVTLEARELFGLIRGERIIHTAHQAKTARDHQRRLMDLCDHPRIRPFIRKCIVGNEPRIEGRDGGLIFFLARSAKSGRGFSADVVILDEALELDRGQFAALVPTVSASPNSQIILSTSVPVEWSVGCEVLGRSFDRLRGDEGERRSPLDRACWIEWSAPPGSDLDDEGLWRAVNPGRIPIDVMVSERRALTDAQFAAERLSIWPERVERADFGLVDESVWLSAPKHQRMLAPVWLAVEQVRDGVAGIVAVGRGGPGFAVEVVDEVPTAEVAGLLGRLVLDHEDVVGVAVDGGGRMASRMPEVTASVRRRGVTVRSLTGRDVVSAHGLLAEMLRDGRISHLRDERLFHAVCRARLMPVRDGHVLVDGGGVDAGLGRAAAVGLFAASGDVVGEVGVVGRTGIDDDEAKLIADIEAAERRFFGSIGSAVS